MLEITKKLQEQFDVISASGKLYKADISGDKVWEIYLDTLNKVHGRSFRDPESSYYNCNFCKAFLRRYGNIVAIIDNKIVTLFDVAIGEEYKETVKALSDAIAAAGIKDIFLESFEHLNKLRKRNKKDATFEFGTLKNVKRYNKEEAGKFGVVTTGQIVTFDHMSITVDKKFVNTTANSVETIQGTYRDARNLFKRCMEEIPLDTLELVRDLINQDSLLNGKPHLVKVEAIIKKKKEYEALGRPSRQVLSNWCWEASRDFQYARFKNELIGVLCSDLSLGEEINKACESWNKRVDPVNYMKAKSPITKSQIKLAEKFVAENGYIESFRRRFATVADIRVTEIKHINNETASPIISIFDKVTPTKASRHSKNKFDKVDEVTIAEFMKDVLPTATRVELYLLPKYANNIVSLTTSCQDSKGIFKWDNNYSWTYKGNLAGHSQIKQAVKLAGGNVSGILNARLAWNEDGGRDGSDLDIWAQEPDGTRIGYSTPHRKPRRSPMTGQLDVDNMDPNGKIAVENITWTDPNRMEDGTYSIWVNGYSIRASNGFTVEIEVDGDTYTYAYPTPVKSNQNVKVAKVSLKDGVFTVKDILPSQQTSKDICELETNQFHKVDLVCLSPNHWGDNNVGNKHHFFMLDGAKISEPTVSFHTENLEPELAKHRKVIEALSMTCMLEPEEKHLVGLGFNATVRNDVILKVKGNFERVLKVKF